ncbi:DUF2793 domain-containing protein [Mesorhizobium sp. M4A.F.Ca.ET.020.02.1.1]|uniref:DUF2793 domain-containing protein n=1 Tax=Mesorhizobium sp. M4A.F.Ca.ET.020.02.1.1 TaxID=2496652 RepID=UPI000FD474BF|nr:DUF2793 domain-containing protein [Mesorhizobium sp. M4A.F.Ca.ET.020.02.1.1]RVD39057.1 DUF2793 domain-containing protein [Mesorhizobium sp. M4A.F.Ca.ET.020.02.1.1]
MTTSNRLGITELATSQVDRSVTINEAIAMLEAGVGQFGAVSVGDNAPPGSPAEGDIYVIGTAGSGAWSGHNKQVALYYNSAWKIIPALPGQQAYAADEDAYYYYDGSVWALTSTSGGLGDVTGPGSSTSGHVATFSGTTGKVIQDSGVAISTDATLAGNSNGNLPTEQAVKGYVDGKVAGLSWKQAVRVATTANGTLSTAYENGDTIDGVTLVTGDRILIKNQSSGAENGIYTVNASGAPTRATDADAGAELVNATCYVSEGTANADTQWTCSTNAPITVGSTSLAFAQLTSAGGSVPTSRSLTAGTGLTGGGDLSADRSFAVDINKQTIWMPAAAMTPRTTNGATSGTAEMSSNKNMVSTLDFDASTQEFAQFDIAMPKSWNEGTITFIPYWSHASTTTNFGVVWGLDAVAISDDDTLDVAFGTAQTSTDTGGTTNDLYVGPESSAITVSGSPSAGDLVQFRIHRNPSDGSDTMAIDARLHGVKVLYVIDALKDD